MRFIAVFCFAALMSAPVSAEEKSSCDLYSLEGIQLGMSLNQVRSALPKAKIKQSGTPRNWSKADRKLYKGRTYKITRPGTKSAGQRDRLFAWLNVDGSSRVSRLIRDYTVGVSRGIRVVTEFQVEPETLLAAVRDRLGEPTSDTGQPVTVPTGQFTAHLRIVRWASSECGMSVVVKYGETSYQPGVMASAFVGSEAVTVPVLTAILENSTKSDAGEVIKF